MKLTVSINGHSTDDLGAAIDEVREQIAEGYASGTASNETGGYSFSVSGDPVNTYAIVGSTVPEFLTDEPRYPSLDEAEEALEEGQQVVAEMGAPGGCVVTLDELGKG